MDLCKDIEDEIASFQIVNEAIKTKQFIMEEKTE